ncbi:MAG TPA: sigma-54-dependent Fis family transcriptional regulator, partial [Rhodocyclaceae bacterium]|nr:sigma-54-dependent Fis family transcriptional regulator [Rhodocyclaceae bacterium]
SSGPLIPRVGNESAVADCWERFLQNAPLPKAAVRNVVLESWLRCRSDAVDPRVDRAPAADASTVGRLREEHRQLYQAARPVLEMLREILNESGTLIMLTDLSGTIIDLQGDNRTRHAGESVNLAPGGRWREEVIGTNAIGTAIAAGEPVQIYASEHYCVDVKRWTCAAAPIFDATGKTLLGVIDVSGVKETFHGHSLGLVITAAKQIEAILAGQETELQRQLLEQSLECFTRYGSDFLVLFDRCGRVVRHNTHLQAARELYGINLATAAGSTFDALDLRLPADQRALLAPSWLQREWQHPIRGHDGPLGTLLIVPLGLATLKTQQASRPACVATDGAGFSEVLGDSAVLAAAIHRARRLAPLDLPVLLLGETGVGKEVFSRAIHQAGAKPNAPFVAVNCGALTRELLASELFGYVEGAFTGARRGGQAGKLEQADGGTLFLDEIGEMPLDMQPHLLRVLQDGIVVRLGDTRERRVAIRIIAATNRDLREEVAAGRFREDLFHRLCATSLRLPALRERPEDIDTIVDALNERLARKYQCAPKRIAPEVRQALQRYRWPGNVRELQNTFEAVFALCDDGAIDLADLPEEITHRPPPGAGSGERLMPVTLSGRLDSIESQAILAAVANANGNISHAARALGISRSTMYIKLSALRQGAADPSRRQ